MTRKTFKILFAVSVVFTLTLSHNTFGADKPKVCFLLKTMQEERYQRDKADFTAKAESLGADVVFDSANVITYYLTPL